MADCACKAELILRRGRYAWPARGVGGNNPLKATRKGAYGYIGPHNGQGLLNGPILRGAFIGEDA